MRSITLLLALALTGPTLEAGLVRAINGVETSRTWLGELDDAGTFIFSVSNADPLGTNPTGRNQVFRWDADTGAVTQLTALHDGVEVVGYSWPYGSGVSVSDDGQRITFVSKGDPLGTNDDGSPELFVMEVDGTGLTQLTATTDVRSSIGVFQISGNGQRVVFSSDADYFGAVQWKEAYSVFTDGSGLTRLSPPFASQGVMHPTINDDGTRVAMLIQPDNPIYTVQADGTGGNLLLTQPGWNFTPFLSGDGSRIVYTSNGPFPIGPPPGCSGGQQVGIVDWDGSNERRLTGYCVGAGAESGEARLPSIDDSNLEVPHGAFTNYAAPGTGTFCQSTKIFSAPTDGGDIRQLTGADCAEYYTECGATRISGDGTRLAVGCRAGQLVPGDNPKEMGQLYSMDSNGENRLQLTDDRQGQAFEPDITSDGTRIVFVSDADLDTIPEPYPQLYRVGADGHGLVPLTQFAQRTRRPEEPSISDDGMTVVFTSLGDPLGTNPTWDREVFAVDGDGQNLRQLTEATFRDSHSASISDSGNVVTFLSSADLGGLNPDQVARVWTISPDGSGLTPIGPPDGVPSVPRLDGSGTWAAYMSDGLYRSRVDGTGTELLSAIDGWDVDISKSGDRITFVSNENPLGTNPEQNTEIFLYEVSTATATQLTTTTGGSNRQPRITRDGSAVFFMSDSPEFETNSIARMNRMRVDLGTHAIDRVDALEVCGSVQFRSPAVPDETGDRAVFTAYGDCNGENPDGNQELFLVDQGLDGEIHVSPGNPPTTVDWLAESGLRRYDVIRGHLSELSSGATTDLGDVLCLENDSRDLDTVGDEDTALPPVTQGFFYLYRGTEGGSGGPGSYGTSSSGLERLPASGGCDD
ncbi:hypothetical protein ABI59_09335 [Acidobacteria bacterium Mor1]|nr:hypothetical protein ABI59_09335 [Acidobacteria bacterium Mor1]